MPWVGFCSRCCFFFGALADLALSLSPFSGNKIVQAKKSKAATSSELRKKKKERMG